MIKLLISLLFITSCATKITYYTKGIESFDGSENLYRGSIPLNISNNTSELSIGMWVRPNKDQYANLIAIGGNDKNNISTSRASIHLQGDGSFMIFARTNDSQEPKVYLTTKDSMLIKPNTWTHITLNLDYKRSKAAIYVNGESVEFTPKNFKFPSERTSNKDSIAINIGGEEDGKNSLFNGKISNVFIKRKLSNKELIHKLLLDKPN